MCENDEATYYFVACYDVHLGYGGPEEGGWWYGTGALVTDLKFLQAAGIEFPRFYTTREEAHTAAKTMDLRLKETLNVGKLPKHSVNSDGVYESMVFEDIMPIYFPDKRPHYE